MKKTLLNLLVVAAVALGGVATAGAVSVIDQTSPVGYCAFNVRDSFRVDWQQAVTVGITGDLIGIDLWKSGNSDTVTPHQINFYIKSGDTLQTNDISFSSIVTINDFEGWSYIDIASAGLHFNDGDKFVFGIKGLDVNTDWWGVGGSIFPGLYADGDLYLNDPGSTYDYSVADIAFRTYVETEPALVPEPSTMALFGAGVVGLVVARMRKKRL
jgi:hypothetical protein